MVVVVVGEQHHRRASPTAAPRPRTAARAGPPASITTALAAGVVADQVGVREVLGVAATRSMIIGASSHVAKLAGRGAAPHLLPDHRHRPLASRSTARSASRRSAAMPIREEAINVFLNQPGDGEEPRLELTYNYGVDALRARHRLRPHRDQPPTTSTRRSRELAGAGHRAGAPALHGPRGRLPDLLRARPGRLPCRIGRTRGGRITSEGSSSLSHTGSGVHCLTRGASSRENCGILNSVSLRAGGRGRPARGCGSADLQ